MYNLKIFKVEFTTPKLLPIFMLNRQQGHGSVIFIVKGVRFFKTKRNKFFRIFCKKIYCLLFFFSMKSFFLTTLFELGCINWFFIVTLGNCLEIEPSKWKANSNRDYFDRVYSCMKPELNCYSWVFIALLLLWFLAPWLATASVISLHPFKNCPALPCSHHLGRKLGWKRREIAHFTG